ncbi:hypothetical protein GCM10022205_36300 [Spinactinospora alkalitolerans]
MAPQYVGVGRVDVEAGIVRKAPQVTSIVERGRRHLYTVGVRARCGYGTVMEFGGIVSVSGVESFMRHVAGT